jgi:hypothetical protein
MSFEVNFYGKRHISNKYKHEICDYILKGFGGRSGRDYYLHFEIMDYNRGLFTGFLAVGREFHRRIKRFRVKVVRWPGHRRPFSGRDELYKLLPGEKFAG